MTPSSIIDSPTLATHEMPRLHRPNLRDFYENYVCPQRPAIVTGMMDDWGAMKTWDAAYLEKKIGNERIKVSRTEGARSVFADDVKRVVEMTFSEFLKLDHRKDAPVKHLMMQRAMEKAFPGLLPDVGMPPLFDPKHLFQINFWYLPADNVTLLHCDFAANLLAMIKGKKRIVLYPPNAPVYPHPVIGNFAQVDIENPDPIKHPKFHRRGVFDFLLEPGEMLWLPGLWWHQVYSEPSISVNYWWWPRGRALANTVFSRQMFSYGAKRVRQMIGRKLFKKQGPTSVYDGD